MGHSTHWVFGKFDDRGLKSQSGNHPTLRSFRANVGLYEHPACQAPAAPLFLSFLSSEAFSSSTAPQAFPRPDRRMLAPARAGCVKAGRFSAATVRLGLYTTEHDGRLDGFGRLLLLSCYLSVFAARVIPITIGVGNQ